MKNYSIYTTASLEMALDVLRYSPQGSTNMAHVRRVVKQITEIEAELSKRQSQQAA